MQIYVDLVRDNIESFLASAFPVAKSLLADDRWLDLVRRFVREHSSRTPYFLEISREFIDFLAGSGFDDLPAFMVELCHYEWIELELTVAQGEETSDVEPHGDLLSEAPVVTPFLRLLTYEYPVHRIGAGFQPDSRERTQLVAHRRPDHRVGFMQVNRLAMGLLERLDGRTRGADAIQLMVSQLPHVEPERLRDSGRAALCKFRELGIVRGTKRIT